MAETSPSFTVTMNDGKSAKPEQPVPEPASKDMTWTDGKQTIKYTATAEMLPLHTDDGTLIGHMFALSYVSDAADKSDRPATFCWNGGPGVAIGGHPSKHNVEIRSFDKILLLIYTGMHIHMQKSRIEDRKYRHADSG